MYSKNICYDILIMFLISLETYSTPKLSKYVTSSSVTYRYPANIYLFKVNYGNTRKRCEICSKLAIKTPERRHVFIANFEHISHLFLVFPLLTLNKYMLVGYLRLSYPTSSY